MGEILLEREVAGSLILRLRHWKLTRRTVDQTPIPSIIDPSQMWSSRVSQPRPYSAGVLWARVRYRMGWVPIERQAMVVLTLRLRLWKNHQAHHGPKSRLVRHRRPKATVFTRRHARSEVPIHSSEQCKQTGSSLLISLCIGVPSLQQNSIEVIKLGVLATTCHMEPTPLETPAGALFTKVRSGTTLLTQSSNVQDSDPTKRLDDKKTTDMMQQLFASLKEMSILPGSLDLPARIQRLKTGDAQMSDRHESSCDTLQEDR